MTTVFRRENLDPSGPPLYEQLAAQVERRIANGALADGERLPTLRQLAKDLALSGTTVASAFALLSQRGLIRGEVGRGTFVIAPRPADRTASLPAPAARNPWRKRALTTLGARLRRMHPNALDCSTGRPDPELLPVASFRRAWRAAADGIGGRDLQYGSPEPVGALAEAAIERLASDNIRVREPDLFVGNSAQQLMTLALRMVAARRRGPVTVAVEEPGYPTILDAFEKDGAALCGVAVDEDGAIPASLEAALRAGAQMVLLTPRAQNPTGASWSADRLYELAGVLAAYPEAVVVEDDQFGGGASARAGSLLGDARVEDQVMYVRSFSKSLGPDLRVAIGAARPRLSAAMREAKAFTDGWTSRLLQRTAAAMLRDPKIGAALRIAAASYGERREAAVEALLETCARDGVEASAGRDGVNVWVRLPAGVDCLQLVEAAAEAGVLLAPGEPFHIKPGHSGHVRFNAGSVSVRQAAVAGRLLGQAIRSCDRITETSFHV